MDFFENDECGATDPGTDTIMENRARLEFDYCEFRYILRTQRCEPEKYAELLHMHLAFRLDLSENKLELLLDQTSEPTLRKRRQLLTTAAASVFKKKEKVNVGVFGAPLTDEGICLMLPLICFLANEKNVCKEGLFRKPGNRTRMNQLRDALNVHGPATPINPDKYTPHDVAGVLKEFLRELPEPLLTDRHMEAHRQIREMGSHAQEEEHKERYRLKKLTALQLLMMLMPAPARKMTLHVVWLLQRVADCFETKMTPTTLGTIFAPIFFLSRKVDATEMCSAISQTEPGLAFMIEHAHELYKVPEGLLVDLADYWRNHTSQSLLSSEADLESTSRKSTQIKKSISGRTLHTNVCYLNREASRCDDVAANTQVELDKLFAHIQTLPDTPKNMRLKEQLQKATTTPSTASSVKKRHRSRSIGTSIRKRLPSLGRSKNKKDMSRFSASSSKSSSSCSSTESTAVTPALSELIESPAVRKSFKATCSTRESRPRLKRHRALDASSECTSPKQECTSSDEADTGNAAASQPCLMICPSPEAAAKAYACNGAITPSEDESSKDSSECSASPTFSNNNTISEDTLSEVDIHNDDIVNEGPGGGDCLKTSDHSVSENIEHVTSDASLELSVDRVDEACCESAIAVPLTPNTKVFQTENGISYMKRQQAATKVAEQWKHDRNVPLPKMQSRPLNAPGTPVMPRRLLSLAQGDLLETSI